MSLKTAMLIAVVPFLAWILLQMAQPWIGMPAVAYAVRTAVCAALAVACWERRIDRGIIGVPASDTTPFAFGVSMRHALLGAAAGLVVFAVWVAPENCAFYRKWLVWPPGAVPEEQFPPPYAPAVCGWSFTIFKLIGSAFVIAPIEEVFYRSFLYRWLQAKDFRTASINRFDLGAFVITAAVFACEHDRWLVGAVAGVIYGGLAVKRGLGTAIVAHVTTNLALGFYVIFCGKWGFW